MAICSPPASQGGEDLCVSLLKRTDDEALYAQLVSVFRTRILNGDLLPGAQISTEIELARENNISRGTVRQAMAILVREGLLERVPGRGTFVRQLPVAQNGGERKVSSTSKRIGLLLSRRRSELDLDILSGVEYAAKARGYQVSFAFTEESAEEQARDINHLRADHVAGMIIFPLTDITYDEAIWKLRDDGVPFVLIDRYFPDLQSDCVTSDNVGGGYRATEHLIILGHTRIAFCHASFGTLTTTSVRDRHIGYRKALEEYGIPYDEALVFQHDSARKHLPYVDFLSQPDRPTAIFTSHDHEAAEVIRAANQLGIHLPEELAVVGFDNVEFSAYMNPPLTTIAQPSRDVGLRAADLLISRIEGNRSPARHIEIPTNLVVRESCGVKGRIRAVQK
jgi:GntR family transcriptional regulator of arabinose operon